MHDGELVIRWTIWTALLFYLLTACVSFLFFQPKLARAFWTFGWLAYLCHVVAAFHFVHGWSHQHAIERTQEISGFGPGIYVSHFFTLVWTADVVLWWVWPTHRRRRAWWANGVVHGFMLFILFNGAVVFADGPSRWVGIGLFMTLALIALKALTKRGQDL